MSIAKVATFYPLAQIFPKDQYNKNLDKAFILQYLIAYGQVKSAIGWIKQHPEMVSSKEPKYQLTPLHVCAIVGDKETAATLLSIPEVSPTPQDKRKWTPLHHAAAAKDSVMIQLLEDAAKVKRFVFDSLKNNYGATYLDLKNMVTMPEYGQEIVFYYQEEEKILPGNAKKFNEFTGTIYCKSLVTIPQALIEDWVQAEEEVSPATETHLVHDLNLQTHEYPLSKLLAFRKREPCVYLTKDPQVGCSLKAYRDIQAGELIEEYGGELIPQSKEKAMNPNYSVDRVAADKFANAASKAADSFPNSRIFLSTVIEGVARKPALIAISYIKKGDPITLDYGFESPVKKEYHKELRQEHLQGFLKDFSQHWERCKKINFHSSFSTPIEELEILSKMTYVFSTPHVLFQIIFEKMFSKNEYEILITDTNLLSQLEIDDHEKFNFDIKAYFNFQEVYEALPLENQKILREFIHKVKTTLCGRYFIKCLVNLVEKKKLLRNSDLENMLFSELYPELVTRNRIYTTIFSSNFSIQQLKQKEKEFIEQFNAFHSHLTTFLQMCIHDCEAHGWQTDIDEKKQWLVSFRNSLL